MYTIPQINSWIKIIFSSISSAPTTKEYQNKKHKNTMKGKKNLLFVYAIANTNHIKIIKKWNTVIWHQQGSIVQQVNSMLKTWKISLTFVSKRLKAFSNIVLLIRSISDTCCTSYNRRTFKHCYHLFWYPSYGIWYTIKILVLYSKWIPIQSFKVLTGSSSEVKVNIMRSNGKEKFTSLLKLS